MSKKKKVVIIVSTIAIIFILIFAAFLIGVMSLFKTFIDVVNSSSKKQEEIVNNAQIYLEQKYDKKFEVVSSEKIWHGNSPIPSTTTTEILITFNDDIKVVYSYETKEYYDNYQSQEIVNDIKKEIWEPMELKIDPSYYFVTDDNTNIFVNSVFSDELLKVISFPFFHNYYEGNITNYLKDEKIKLNIPDGIFIISEDDNYQDRLNIFIDTINTYFDDGIVFYTVLTKELYDAVYSYPYKTNDVFGIGTVLGSCNYEGCWVHGYLSGKDNYYSSKKFIEVTNGIYVSLRNYPSLNGDKIILEDGDITFKESITAQELQNKMDNNLDKDDEYRYIINTNKPIYEIQVSDSLKNKLFKVSGYEPSSISVIFKLNKEELNIEDKNNLYVYNTNKRNARIKYGDLIAYANMKEQYEDFEDYIGNYGLDIYKKYELNKFEYISTSINLSQEEYYWVGNQTREENIEN